MNSKHLRLNSDYGSSTTSEVMQRLHLRLNVRDMQLATLKFKLTLEEDTDNFQNSFYGTGYVFTTILQSDAMERDFFLKTGKLLIGTVDDVEFCWISFCGWYILADGISIIRMVKSETTDFVISEEINAMDMYQRHYLNRNPNAS